MDGLDEAAELDTNTAAESIDRTLAAFRRGVVTSSEALAGIRGTASLFLRFAVAPAEDAELVLEYARTAVEDVALARAVMDPVLVESFDEWLRGERIAGELQATLDALLEGVRADVAHEMQCGLSEIAELCRSGRRTHRTLLSLTGATRQILCTAFDLGCAEGLRDAVSPAHRSDGQIAGREVDPTEFVTALDLLARMALDPDRGSDARSALLDLADHLELAGAAVVRLPLHLLDDRDRFRLLDIHERRTMLFHDDMPAVPLGVGLLRDNRLVRGAVWQAFDARHLR